MTVRTLTSFTEITMSAFRRTIRLPLAATVLALAFTTACSDSTGPGTNGARLDPASAVNRGYNVPAGPIRTNTETKPTSTTTGDTTSTNSGYNVTAD